MNILNVVSSGWVWVGRIWQKPTPLDGSVVHEGYTHTHSEKKIREWECVHTYFYMPMKIFTVDNMGYDIFS